MSAVGYFSTGAAETDRANARMELWKVDFMLIDNLLKVRECKIPICML